MSSQILTRDFCRHFLQADAVIGMRQTCVPMADGTGRFHVQLYGTAVRKTAQAQADAAGGAAAMGMMPGGAAGLGQNGRQEGDFLMDGSTLVRYIGQSEYVRVPDGVINIGAEAFHNARVVSVELPDSVTEIREGAFSGCEHLERVRLSTRLLVIRKNAFQSCISLSDIALPASLQEIDIPPPQRSGGQGRGIPAQPQACLEKTGTLPVLRRLLQGRPQGRQSLQYVRNGKRLLIFILLPDTFLQLFHPAFSLPQSLFPAVFSGCSPSDSMCGRVPSFRKCRYCTY